MRQDIEEGIQLFNTQKFFEAHEALEAVWLKAEGDEKLFLHGLIQVAAAFHHYLRGNPDGFRSLLEKGIKKIQQFGDSHAGLDLAGFRRQLQPWRIHESQSSFPQTSGSLPLPRIGDAASD